MIERTQVKLFCLQVVSIDTEEHTVSFHDGTTQHYNQLLIATGARLGHLISLCIFCSYYFSPGTDS